MRSSLRHRCSSRWRLGLLLVLGLALSGIAQAIPLSHKRTLNNVDYVVGGIAGVGGGSGTITISGVSGTVTQAFLYWHGINPAGTYDNPTVTINGNSVTGNSLGDSSTNCWGNAGSSRAFEADVTQFVTGNGPYTIAGLSSCAFCNANGTSLVIVFNDGNPANNHDLAFFTGNDSNIPQGFPGDDAGWHASLPGIIYVGGPVMAVFHAADGQSVFDDSLTLSTGPASLTILDTPTLWEGNSLPNAGTSRSGSGGLWDIHRFDITAAFGLPGTKTLNVDGMETNDDCVGLVLMLLELEPTVIEVLIDVKPGDGNNPINLKNKGVIPVAILTTDLFDAQDVDPLQVRFGRGQAIEAHQRGHLEDVNGDGRLDMVLHFLVQESGILPTDVEVCLTGKTTNGTPFQGCDSITVLH